MPKTDRTKHPKCRHCGRTLKRDGYNTWYHKHTGKVECTRRVTYAEPKQVKQV